MLKIFSNSHKELKHLNQKIIKKQIIKKIKIKSQNKKRKA